MPSRTPFCSVLEARTKKYRKDGPKASQKGFLSCRKGTSFSHGISVRRSSPPDWPKRAPECLPGWIWEAFWPENFKNFVQHLGRVWILSFNPKLKKKYGGLSALYFLLSGVFRQAGYRLHISLICSQTSFANTMGGTILPKTQKMRALHPVCLTLWGVFRQAEYGPHRNNKKNNSFPQNSLANTMGEQIWCTNGWEERWRVRP